MDEQIIHILKEKLKSLDTNYDELKPQLQDYLYKIESAISLKVTVQQEHLNALKELKVNISSIAKDTSISRKTLYNNPILVSYIEISLKDIEESSSIHIINSLKKKIKELEEINYKMLYRDIDIENIKLECEQYQKKLKESKSKNKELHERNLALSKELNELKLQYKKLNSNLTLIK